MNEEILNYAIGINSNQETLNWLNTTGIKSLRVGKTTPSELEHIVDYFNSDSAPKRLLKMSFADAKRKANEWSQRNQKKGRNLEDSEDDIETIHDFLDGTRIVKLKTKKACQREGFLMSHCVGGYTPSADVHIYSYRDKKNMPHATFEVQKRSNEIVQIKGKGNGDIHPKYIHPILAFLKTIGMNIRPSDMRNLGYYHLPKEHLEFLNNFPEARKQIVMINGEAYAV